jgi:hypothetical protein
MEANAWGRNESSELLCGASFPSGRVLSVMGMFQHLQFLRSQLKYGSERERLHLGIGKVQKRALPDLWPQSKLLRGGEQGLFGCGYILSAQLGFRAALGDLIDGSISSEFDTCQEGAIAVLMEHQRVRA